jgi:Domain of unknown function (DUF222)/HNH endonuclease
MQRASITEVLGRLQAALDILVESVSEASELSTAPAGTLSTALSEVARAEARLASVKLRLVAAAQAANVAVEDGSTDTAAWTAKAVGGNRSRAWGAVWLADALRDTYHGTAAALADGRISEEHAAVIVAAGRSVPDGITPTELARCEEVLVAKAERMKPAALRRAARRLLEPISRRLADEHQETQLREQERHAERETWLVLGDNGDGTWTGKFTLPDLHAQTLLARLDALSAPRRHNRNRLGHAVSDATLPGMGAHYNRAEALGLAFAELLEHLPVEGHTRSSYALVVHVGEEQLRQGAGAAVLETGAEISIGQARRLACTAGILPLVLSGASVPLDLGREQRLFTRSQAIALSSRHEHCAAEGCQRPFAWCEVHHLRPWSAGGPTDLANAVPLCGFHHRRIHDDHYTVARAPDGSLRFTHRWPSRRTRQQVLAA